MLRINFENKFKVKIRVLKEGQGQFHFFNPCFSSEIRVSNIFQRFFEHSAQLWHRVVFLDRLCQFFVEPVLGDHTTIPCR